MIGREEVQCLCEYPYTLLGVISDPRYRSNEPAGCVTKEADDAPQNDDECDPKARHATANLVMLRSDLSVPVATVGVSSRSIRDDFVSRRWMKKPSASKRDWFRCCDAVLRVDATFRIHYYTRGHRIS